MSSIFGCFWEGNWKYVMCIRTNPDTNDWEFMKLKWELVASWAKGPRIGKHKVPYLLNEHLPAHLYVDLGMPRGGGSLQNSISVFKRVICPTTFPKEGAQANLEPNYGANLVSLNPPYGRILKGLQLF